MSGMLKKLVAAPLVLLLWNVLPAHAQTSVALSALGSFPSTTHAVVTRQNPASQAGFMIELRHISNPLVGYDVSYTFHRANQVYQYTGPTPLCPLPACVPPPPESVSANAHSLTLNWVVSLPIANFRVFALAGGGFQRFSPKGSEPAGIGTQSDTKGLFDYGVGLDWTLLPHLGLRFQYRDNMYKAPDLDSGFGNTDKFLQDSQPMIGAFFRF